MSRAQLVDERSEEEVNDSNVETLEAPEDPIESPEEEVAQEEPSLPEKYQNKSLQEVVQMHQEAEKLLGKQSSEVGELRGVVDDYIQTQLKQQAPVQQQEEDDTDFFVDPQAAVNRAIDNHPKIQEANQVTQRYRKETALAELSKKHPEMDTILKDTKFAEWIKGSKIRTQLFVQADQQYDYDAADELFSNWKERSQVVQQTAQAEKAARKSAVQSANTGNARGTSEGSRKKIYRRADLIKLMKEDPDRYMALQPEIMAAYADRRVK